MPGWVTVARHETSEDVAFLSGAALAHLDLVIRGSALPQDLLRDRLALRAAEACMALSGRPERAAALRDALHLLRPGDLPGPAGEVCLAWRRAAERPLSDETVQRALPEIGAEQITLWRRAAGVAGPVPRAAAVLEAVLTQAPRAETAGLILAEATLARALGWDHVVPLLALSLRRADLRLRGAELRRSCHRAVIDAATEATGLAADLARRAERLRAVAPKLRAKGAEAAVGVFLSRDAVAPGALPLPDRAARRLCDRLVALGAVRELTGRETFRLYGV